ncbi:major facilitator superfamily domain-containing protein [Naematelia encephala]|uniref:Major facilitator superfamily domain-containing protein n=1 Tax=Naematelia encephala TaxID=71784 RepID=A0A1Y2BKL9_9TREE|nr:major facilitator superfamily domain-containing protein [Naematelia encephala]
MSSQSDYKSGPQNDSERGDKDEGLQMVTELPSEGETHVTMGDLLRGTVAQPLTHFERKAALINEEINKFGFGKYQQCIWFLCGFGYFLDLAWAQGVGLMATAVYQEMNVPSGKEGLIFTCANAGLAVGAFSFGIITDIIGRKWAFNITCLITSVFGMLLAAPKYNYGAICGIYFLSSVGLGGNIPIDATIALEFLPQNRRFLVALLSMWQPIGVVVASAVAYGTAAKYRCDVALPACNIVAKGEACCSVSSNMGWRYEVIVIGCMTLFVFFLRYFVFKFHESPKFLLGKGKEQEAIDVLHKIAKFNGAAPPTLTVEHFREVDQAYGIVPTHQEGGSAKNVILGVVQSLGHLKGLFLNKLECFIFILLALAYMGDYWSFNLAGSFLPIVLLRNNVSSGATTVTDTYREYVYIYLPGVIGAGLALFSIQLPLLGRKWSLVLSAALQGLSMAMYTQVKTTAGYVGLNALEYVMQTYFNAVLYASAPELFDTSYRASASGMLSCLGRIAGIVAPFAGQHFIGTSSSGILWLGAGGIWLSSFVMIFLPVEMRNRQMF